MRGVMPTEAICFCFSFLFISVCSFLLLLFVLLLFSSSSSPLRMTASAQLQQCPKMQNACAPPVVCVVVIAGIKPWTCLLFNSRFHGYAELFFVTIQLALHQHIHASVHPTLRLWLSWNTAKVVQYMPCRCMALVSGHFKPLHDFALQAI